MNSVNVGQVIDESKFNRFHGSVLFWCAFCIVFDAYDLVVFGSVVPILMDEWSLTANQVGALGSYALIGMMLGALIFGPLADKLGRKNIILFCVALFSLFTFLIGFANGVTEFGTYRFIAGLGLGGVMPNAIALMSEYSPKHLKSTLVSIMFSGYSVGGMLAAGLGIFLIPNFGWQSVFFIGGLPLLALPFMYKSLPESPEILMIKKQTKTVEGILAKVKPGFVLHERSQLEITKHGEKGSPVIKLFTKGRALSTVLLWISFFMCLLMIYGINTWLPKFMESAGYGLESSLLFLFVLNFGAIFGAIGGGWLADKWNPKSVLVLFYLFAALSLFLLGFKANMIVLLILVAMAGAATIGTQIIANAYVSQYYPSDMRSSGIGWSLGIGRLGAVAGPLMGGMLLTMNLPIKMNFLAFAIPGIIAAISIMLVQEKYSSAANAKISSRDKNVTQVQKELEIN